jgi:hypothetical protein
MPRPEVILLTAIGVFLVAVYAAAGWLVVRRVRESWDGPHGVLAAILLVTWPIVVLGVEIGWLMGLNEWHFRPDR